MTARADSRSPRCSPVGPYLPRVDGVAAHASRLLHDTRFVRTWESVLPGIALVPVQRAPDGALQRLLVECDLGQIEVLIDTASSAALTIAASGEGDLPAPLQQLAAHALFEPILAKLSKLGLKGAKPAAWHSFDRSTASLPECWYAARAFGSDLARFAIARAPETAFAALRERLGAAPHRTSLREHIALRGAVTLGERSVSLSLLRSLATGDVLVLPTMDSPGDGTRAWIHFGAPASRRYRAPVHIDDDTVTLEERPAMNEDSYEDEDAYPSNTRTEEADDSDAADALQGLDVTVRFEIDTMPLSLADLEAMEPGYVIELRTPLAAARVRLVAGGRTIGHADLVAVGDRLGARIEELATHDAARRPG